MDCRHGDIHLILSRITSLNYRVPIEVYMLSPLQAYRKCGLRQAEIIRVRGDRKGQTIYTICQSTIPYHILLRQPRLG